MPDIQKVQLHTTMAKGKKTPANKASGTKKNAGQIISDPRFAAVHSDPRFQRFPKTQRKVDIDERFASALRAQFAASFPLLAK